MNRRHFEKGVTHFEQSAVRPAALRVFLEDRIKSREYFPDPHKDLVKNRLPGHSWAASTNVNFGGAYFPRESNEVSLQVLPCLPDVVEEHILRAGSYQGTRTCHRTEEKPGSIPHEIRTLKLIAASHISAEVEPYATARLRALST